MLTPGGYDSVAQLCIAKDHKTPLINPEPEPAGWYKEAAPYLWNMLMSKDRTHKNHVRWLIESKQLKPSMRVGVVYHGIPNVGPPVEDALLPELRKHGIKPVQIAKLSSDDEQAVAQINQVVLQFQRANVNYVFMPMNLIFKTQFMQVAEQQRYFPDVHRLRPLLRLLRLRHRDVPRQVVGSHEVRELAGDRRHEAGRAAQARRHPSVLARTPTTVYNRAHKGGYSENGEKNQDDADVQRALHIGMGSQILLWEQAADRLGPNLTRPGWGAEMGKTGAFDKLPVPHPLTFGPNKWDGPDYLTVVEWHAEAGDGYEERSYRQIVKPFRSYY